MPDNKFKPYPKEEGPEEKDKKHHPHPPHPEPPPHILKEIFDMKEKIGKLEGKVEIITNLIGKTDK